MHRMKYTHYDDSNLLDISYDLTIEFSFDKSDPCIEDIKIVAATVQAGSSEPVEIMHEGDLDAMNLMLYPLLWKDNEPIRVTSQRFVDDVETAIAEHLDEQDQSARESAADARFQAMRDGE